jgi:hypothetical protein
MRIQILKVCPSHTFWTTSGWFEASFENLILMNIFLMIQSSFLAETADLLLEVSNKTPTEEKDVNTQGTRVQLLNKRLNYVFKLFIHFYKPAACASTVSVIGR